MGRIEFDVSFDDSKEALAAMKLVAGEQVDSVEDYRSWLQELNGIEAFRAERAYRTTQFPTAKIKSFTRFEHYKQILDNIWIPTSCTQLVIRRVPSPKPKNTNQKILPPIKDFEISRTEQRLDSISFDISDLEDDCFSPAYTLGATLEDLEAIGGGPCKFEINSITTDADLKHMRDQMFKAIARKKSTSQLNE